MSDVLISRNLLEMCLDKFLKLTKKHRERAENELMVCAMDGAEVAIKTLKDKLDRFPAVDAVPVVRCKECIKNDLCSLYRGAKNSDGYCYWGAKMDLKEDEHDHQSI